MIHRESNGVYVIEPKRIENSDKFRQAAIHFQKYGYYTSAPVSTTAYLEYWREERNRCLQGYYADDGEWISGYFYFYLNYCPILLVREEILTDSRNNSRKIIVRKRDFPDFWDSDYDYYMAIEHAEREGKHLVVLKARGKGYSFKGGSMLCRNYFLISESKSYAIASEMEYLTKDGLLSKAWEFMDFIDQNTGWAKKRQQLNKMIHRRASYLQTDDRGIKTEKGYLSEIMGISLKNDPDKARGKRGKLILWEEGGKFPDLVKAWQIAQPSVENNGVAHGLMVAYGTGGCVCAGTKVWNNEGNLINIEDLVHSEGILGYDGEKVSKEEITYWQPPTQKECYRLTTNTGRTLECSNDHPILTASQSNGFLGHIEDGFFLEAEHLRVGNKIAVIDEVPIFGANKMWDPRTVGWLIGDGTYGEKQSPRIANCEEEINEFLENKYNTTIQLQRLTKNNKVYRETLIKEIIPKLRELGIYGQTKLRKTLPLEVHSYCKKDICELLGGLFDTDGYVNLRYNKKRGTPIVEISISSASENLLNEVRMLLQKLGIHGRMRERLPRENNPKDRNSWFEFTIADTVSALRFSENIKLFPKVKQERLNKIKEVFSTIKPHFTYIRIQGTRYETVVEMEYLGLKDIYNLTAGTTHTYIANGIVTHNTEDADYEGLKELFLFPNGYNALPLKNIWDDGGGKCGFFVPEYVNMYGIDKEKRPLMDAGGNTDYHIATRYALLLRDVVLKGANDRQSIDRHIAEHPFTPAEACLQLAGNIFPKEELIRHLAYIRNSESVSNYKQSGDLDYGPSGKLLWTPAEKPRDILKYRLKSDDNKKGQIVIWEHPVDDPPYGLYIAGCLTPGEKVLTDKGLIDVEDVDYSYKLISKEGNLTDIKALLRYEKNNEDTYELKMSNTFRTTRFTKEHPVYASTHNLNRQNEVKEELFNFTFKKVSELKTSDWVKYPNLYYNSEKFEMSEEARETAWVEGLWLGDGWCSRNKVFVVFNKTDVSQIKRFKSYITKYTLHQTYSERVRENCVEISFSDKAFSTYLVECFSEFANNKYISETLKRYSISRKVQLLLGYLDSDGCVYKDKRNYYSMEFVSCNLKLLEDFQDVAFSIGLVGNLTKLRDKGIYNINGRHGNQNEAYHLRFGHNDTIKFADLANSTRLTETI